MGILGNLKWAFDTIEHELLIKLRKYEVRGGALSWLISYLNNRGK